MRGLWKRPRFPPCVSMATDEERLSHKSWPAFRGGRTSSSARSPCSVGWMTNADKRRTTTGCPRIRCFAVGDCGSTPRPCASKALWPRSVGRVDKVLGDGRAGCLRKGTRTSARRGDPCDRPDARAGEYKIRPYKSCSGHSEVVQHALRVGHPMLSWCRVSTGLKTRGTKNAVFQQAPWSGFTSAVLGDGPL